MKTVPVCETGSDLFASNHGCTVTSITHGWWYYLSVFASTTASQQKVAFEKVVTRLESVLAGVAAPHVVASLSALDCADVDAGGVPVTSSRPTIDLTDRDAPYKAAQRVGSPTICTFALASGTHLAVTIYPQRTSPFQQCSTTGPEAAHAEKVTISDIDQAATVWPGGAGQVLCASDGQSSAEVSAGDFGVGWTEESLAEAGPMVAAVLKAAARK